MGYGHLRYPTNPEFNTRIDLKDSIARDGLCSFIDRKLEKCNGDYRKSIDTYGAVWIVSRLGNIVDNNLQLLTSVYAAGGGQDGSNDDYDVIGEMARWQPDFAAGSYIPRLQLAHERNVRQIEYHLKELSAKFSICGPVEE